MNLAERFVDTGYWLALIDESDAYHARASVLAREIHGPFITTEAILTEVGNTLSAQRWRSRAVALLARIRASEEIEVVTVTADLFARALALFEARPDKEWGLTDCISFVVMRDRGITEALAADRHFTQAGFAALLREP